MGFTGTIDEKLEATGGFGLYQWLLLAAMGMSMFSVGLQMLVMTFLSAEPPWMCLPRSNNCNFTGTFASGSDIYNSRCSLVKGVDWDYTDAFTSIVTEFHLYCDRAHLRRIASSIVYLGWLLGAAGFGCLSDIFGRKKILFTALALVGATSFAGSFVNHIALFTVCRFFVGAGIGGGMLITFVLATEFAVPKKRGFAGTVLWFFTTLSLMVLALLAYFIRDWKVLSAACSIPSILVLFQWWFVPESIRFLLSHAKVEEADMIFERIAKKNGVPLTQMKLEIPADIGKQKWGNVFALFNGKSIALYTTLSWILWFTCSLLYFGVSQSARHLHGSLYLNFFLLSIVEIPANGLAIVTMNKFGRKPTLIVSLFCAAVFLITGAVFPKGNVNKGFLAAGILFAVLAKLFNLIAFDSCYVISAEIFPTTLRNTGMGTSSAVARIGSFLTPYLIWLNDVNQVLPFAIMGGVAFAAGCLSILLPETKGKATKETATEEVRSDVTDDVILDDDLNSTSRKHCKEAYALSVDCSDESNVNVDKDNNTKGLSNLV